MFPPVALLTGILTGLAVFGESVQLKGAASGERNLLTEPLKVDPDKQSKAEVAVRTTVNAGVHLGSSFALGTLAYGLAPVVAIGAGAAIGHTWGSALERKIAGS